MERSLIQWICVRPEHRKKRPADPSSPFNVHEVGGWSYCPAGELEGHRWYRTGGAASPIGTVGSAYSSESASRSMLQRLASSSMTRTRGRSVLTVRDGSLRCVSIRAITVAPELVECRRPSRVGSDGSR